MDTPFVFGKIASKENFTNRKKEIEKLSTNFLSGINTIVISPRRWGKSSLVIQAANYTKEKESSIRFVFLDLYNIRTEEHFYQQLAQEVIKATSSKAEEFIESCKLFLGQLIPKISFSPLPENEFSLGLDWNEVKKQPEDILNLAQKIAEKKGYKIVICIDEFQNISSFGDSLAFQKRLRANWQNHQGVTYCLYGSKRHMLIEVFTSYSMPFYKFGDVVFIDKIKEKDWLPFIIQRFNDTGKEIDKDEAKLIVSFAECHPYYVQQIAQQVWLRTSTKCSKEIVNDAFENLVLQMSLLFQTITDGLSNTQVNFLEALIDGVEKLSSKDIINSYNLGTSANVQRIKQALIQKEILDTKGNNIDLIDPIYKYWLQKYYFKA